MNSKETIPELNISKGDASPVTENVTDIVENVLPGQIIILPQS